MKLKQVKNGIIFNIFAIILDNGVCPVEEFLEQLKINDPSSLKSFVTIFNRHADHGSLRNEKKV